jgi:methyltransferase (TIGR00027 family)
MKTDTPSRTAAFVAALRTMARELPPEARLADDPYGAEFEGDLRRQLHRALAKLGIPVHRLPGVTGWILEMQVRTRLIDDAVRAFVADGGRQIVLLGAGYDVRALRIPELAAVRVFEIDHPATQRHKRDVLARLGANAGVAYLTWDFETRPLHELPAALAEAGCDPHERTFTIWEGVTMYLTEAAIDASLRAVRGWSPPGSRLAITYFTRTRLRRPRLMTRAARVMVARLGEPWRFGWEEGAIGPYLQARGFALVRDVSLSDGARELLPPAMAQLVMGRDQRFALAGA